MLLTTVGAFAAFSLMAIAIGTDYWLYSSAHICNGTNITTDEAQGPPRRARGDLTHSGLWRICCLEGTGGPLRDGAEVGGNNFPGGRAERPELPGRAQPEPEPEPRRCLGHGRGGGWRYRGNRHLRDCHGNWAAGCGALPGGALSREATSLRGPSLRSLGLQGFGELRCFGAPLSAAGFRAGDPPGLCP